MYGPVSEQGVSEQAVELWPDSQGSEIIVVGMDSSICWAKLQVFACTFPATHTGGAPQKGGKLGCASCNAALSPHRWSCSRLGLLGSTLVLVVLAVPLGRMGKQAGWSFSLAFPKALLIPKKQRSCRCSHIIYSPLKADSFFPQICSQLCKPEVSSISLILITWL